MSYEAAFVKDDSDEFNEPYLPARYKEIVRKKKQRRLLKKTGMIAVAVIAVVVVYLLLNGNFAGTPQPVPSPTQSPTPQNTAVQPAFTTLVATKPPEKTPVPPTVVTTRPPAGSTAVTNTPEPVQTAMANTYKNMTSSAVPNIKENQAEDIARAAFRDLPAGDMSVQLTTSPDFGLVWKFTLLADTTVEASGLIDADTGTVVTFNRTIHPGGRSQNPVLTIGDARQSADSAVYSRNNGILSINMSESRYVPLDTPGGSVAGRYQFIYNRIVQDYPCDADGFIVSVDAISGAITEYVQRWQTPENAFMIAAEAVVPRHEAIFTVQSKAESLYPSSISTLRPISVDLRWKDRHDPATIPRLSSIPLVWKVVFKDDTIRANPNLAPGVGWVDAQTGELLEFTYRH